MKLYSMEFDGSVLQRGFWLYVWRVVSADREVLYVGRTGDSSSANASSPFRRIGQHLEDRANAKGNALARQLGRCEIDPKRCRFSMAAIGPLFPEQLDFESHKVYRDRTGALERELALWLSDRGYEVLGIHHSRVEADPEQFAEIVALLSPTFPIAGCGEAQ